jgi:hypothetical protein
MVVDARIINDMKSHLSNSEFWLLVEHLYAVGRAKGSHPAPFRCRVRVHGPRVPAVQARQPQKAVCRTDAGNGTGRAIWANPLLLA